MEREDKGLQRNQQLYMITTLQWVGVDKVHQQQINYPITRNPGKKYYKKIFVYWTDLAVWNSHILYNVAVIEPRQKKALTHQKFHMQII